MSTSMSTTQASKRIGIRACVLQFSILMILAFGIAALFGPEPLWAVAADGRSTGLQVAWGIASGLALFQLARFAIRAFPDFRLLARDIAGRADFGGMNSLWFGLCAGIGEEFLARGAIQPLLGIWWTSVLFVLAHAGTGGFKSMNWAKFGYAVLVFLVSVVLGYLRLEFGLMAAAVSHSVADTLIFFVLLSKEAEPNLPTRIQ